MSRGPFPSILGAASERPQQFVGLLFGVVALAHFALWTSSTGNPFAAALQRGNAGAAAGAMAGYLTSHPAYALLFLAGVAVVVRASRR